MCDPRQRSRILEAAFGRIQRERMADVPILNPALRVQAVGFRIWQSHCLGVLITPWFMNLMLLPTDGAAWANSPPGSTSVQRFPSGQYEFILGREDEIGHYQMCSLFSPVFEFSDQDTAVATAEAVMAGLMDEANRDDTKTREREIERIWNGEPEAGGADEHDAKEDENRTSLAARFDQPVSRRDVLRGALLRPRE